MPSNDDGHIYGFSKDMANKLSQNVGGGHEGGANEILPRPQGDGGLHHAKTQGSGISGATSSGAQLTGATCDLYECDENGALTDTNVDDTIYNPSTTAIAANTFIMYGFNDAGLRVAVMESC